MRWRQNASVGSAFPTWIHSPMWPHRTTTLSENWHWHLPAVQPTSQAQAVPVVLAMACGQCLTVLSLICPLIPRRLPLPLTTCMTSLHFPDLHITRKCERGGSKKGRKSNRRGKGGREKGKKKGRPNNINWLREKYNSQKADMLDVTAEILPE